MRNGKLWRVTGLFLVLVAMFVGQPGVARAQENTHQQAVLAIPRTSSLEVMESSITLTPEAGRLHQEVSTRSAEAQAFYDQGIAYLHSYVWVDAARSFHEALRRDPELAMAHLGLSKAYVGATAYAEAFFHLKKAAELAAKGDLTPKEVKWIALGEQQMEAVYAAEEERTSKHQEYKQAIEVLIALDPDDAHAWVMRGNAEESRASGRGQGGRIGAIAYYDAALKRNPGHFAAHHYMVHAYEGLGHYDKAAEHGAQYAAAVPGVPHAQHMYAHVLPRLGRWEEALDQLGKADRLHREYFSAGIDPVEEWHHGHNIHLMGTVHLRLGNEGDAERLFREAFHLKVRSLRDGRFTDPWLEYLLLRGRFEEALAAAREAEKRPLALARLIGAVRAAEALIALDRIEDAEMALQRAKVVFEEFRKVTDNIIYGRLASRYDGRLLKVLEAQLALFGDNPEEGEAVLIRLADGFARSTSFDGWVTGLFRLEQLANVARRAGREKLVEALIERMNRIDPEFTSSVSAAVR